MRSSPEREERIKQAWKMPGATVASVSKYVPCDKDTARKRRPDNIVPSNNPHLKTPITLPKPAPEAGGPTLPPSIAKPLIPFVINTPGMWGVIGDIHLPMHDTGTIEAFVNECRANDVAGVLLNGDIMDMFSMSPFFRIPTRDRFIDEIECGKQFLGWLRSRLPKARIIYRQGNHEFRFTRYVVDRAPALFDLPEITLPSLLKLEDLRIEWIQDKRKVLLGKLPTLHGHELRKGRGVNPARFAFLRTQATCLINHFHQTGEHHVRTFDERDLAVFAVGCSCFKHPDYDPYNDWNHGYAMVRVENDGWFSVHNRRVLDGRVV